MFAYHGSLKAADRLLTRPVGLLIREVWRGTPPCFKELGGGVECIVRQSGGATRRSFGGRSPLACTQNSTRKQLLRQVQRQPRFLKRCSRTRRPYRLLTLLGRRVRIEQSSDSQMGGCTQFFGDEAI